MITMAVLVGHLRWMHGLDNNFDPQTGSTIGLNLKYHTPNFKGFYGTVGFHYISYFQVHIECCTAYNLE